MVPQNARVSPLPYKLAKLATFSVSESWYQTAVNVLRGGDGGEHGLLLYKLVRSLSREDPSVILDIGTARGFSAITMARALIDADAEGKVFTVDIADHLSKLVWHGQKNDPKDPLAGISISRSEVWSRWFQEESGRVTPMHSHSHNILGSWDYGIIDVAFIDGEHTYDAVKRDLSILENLMAPTGVIVLDDYHTGASIGALRSRPVNGVLRMVGRAIKHIWPSMRERLRLGTGNEFVVVKRRYAGIYRAANEFLMERSSEWALEIVSMPSKGDYHEADYSLALLTRRNASSA